tara:strand:- start:8433 stop:8738 length:306 start_codon:yes stop_codon:yes gene_type:complete
MQAGRTFIAASFCLYLGLILSVWAMPTGRFVLVLSNPKAAPGEAISLIAAAGGAFVAQGRFPWMTVGYSEEADFSAKLMEAGALLVLNHQLAIGCLEGNNG